MIVVSEGQYRYTPEQADVLAESKGYGSDNGAGLMEDLDYFCCVDCGNYVIEPGGWSNEYNGVLCDKCAAEADPAQDEPAMSDADQRLAAAIFGDDWRQRGTEAHP